MKYYLYVDSNSPAAHVKASSGKQAAQKFIKLGYKSGLVRDAETLQLRADIADMV